MDYLICPTCQDMPLTKQGDKRVCDNCGHCMDEMQYHIYAAESLDKFNKKYDALERKGLRASRKTFGQRQKSVPKS